MNSLIELKRKCEIIVMEADLTKALAVLDSYECTKMNVSVHYHASERENTSWRVTFRATAWMWTRICGDLSRVCSQEALTPLKDSFGIATYREV